MKKPKVFEHIDHSKEQIDHLKELSRGCPCKYLDEPCSSNCTCLNQFSSSGCNYCCTYGSIEQRKAKAEWIAKKLKQ